MYDEWMNSAHLHTYIPTHVYCFIKGLWAEQGRQRVISRGSDKGIFMTALVDTKVIIFDL